MYFRLSLAETSFLGFADSPAISLGSSFLNPFGKSFLAFFGASFLAPLLNGDASFFLGLKESFVVFVEFDLEVRELSLPVFFVFITSRIIPQR